LASQSVDQQIAALKSALQTSSSSATGEQQAYYQSLVAVELARQEKAIKLFAEQHLQEVRDLNQRLTKIATALSTTDQTSGIEAANANSYRSLLYSAQSQTSAIINAAKQQFQSLLASLPPATDINGRIAGLKKAAQVAPKSTCDPQHTYYQSLIQEELQTQQRLEKERAAQILAQRLAEAKKAGL